MSLLLILVIIWGVLTVALIGLLIYRSILGLREEDQLHLSRSEAGLEKHQLETVDRINRLDPFVKGFSFASGGLLLIIAAIWVYQGLYGTQAL